MKKAVAISILFSVIAGCAGSPAQTQWEAGKNRKAMVGLTLGITKTEVLEVMGNPRKTESYTAKGDIIELWLYLTEGVSAYDRRIRDTNFTPLVFENGKLIGWGWSFLNENVEKYEIRMR